MSFHQHLPHHLAGTRQEARTGADPPRPRKQSPAPFQGTVANISSRRKGTGRRLNFLSSLKGMPAGQPPRAAAQTLRVTSGIWPLLAQFRCRMVGAWGGRQVRH